MKIRTDFVTNSSSSSFMLHMCDCRYSDVEDLRKDVNEVLGGYGLVATPNEIIEDQKDVDYKDVEDHSIWLYDKLNERDDFFFYSSNLKFEIMEACDLEVEGDTKGSKKLFKDVKRHKNFIREAFKNAFGFEITEKDLEAEFFEFPGKEEYLATGETDNFSFTKEYEDFRKARWEKVHEKKNWIGYERFNLTDDDEVFATELWKVLLKAVHYDIDKYGLTRGEQIKKADLVVLGDENEIPYNTMEKLVKKFNIKAYCEHEG